MRSLRSGSLARGSQFRPTALLLIAVSHRLAGELDQADDLFADVAEEGLALGAPEPVVVALGEQAALAIGRGAWVQADECVERAAEIIRRFADGGVSRPAPSPMRWRLASRSIGGTPSARGATTEAQRLRPRLTYALPWVSVQTRVELALAYLALADGGGARTMLRETDAILRRRPDLGTLSASVEELRSSLKTMRAQAPGASTLTTAELRVMPYLGTHLSFREVGERMFISQHTVKSHAMAIYRKLNVTSRSAAVERARELGLL